MQTLLCSALIEPTQEVYVSYAWGQNERVVDDLCNVMEAEGWLVIRDKTAME